MTHFSTSKVVGLLLTIFIAVHAAGFVDLRFVEQLDKLAYDTKIRLFSENEIDPRVVIVAIDEESLSRVGHWPWPRSKIIRLVENLFGTYDVDTVAFDVVFAEEESLKPLITLKELCSANEDQECQEFIAGLGQRYQPDWLLGEALSHLRVVLGYYFTTAESERQRTGALPAPLFPANRGLAQHLFAPRATGYTANLPVLQEGAGLAGFFSNPLVDRDGIFRRVPLLHEYDDALYASLALATAQSYLGSDAEAVVVDDESGLPRFEGISLGLGTVELDAEGGVLIPYRGPGGSFRYIPAHQILSETVIHPEELADTIVLIGTTAVGLIDTRATPVQSVYPGVEVHANVIAGLLDGIFKAEPPYIRGARVALIVLVGVLLTLVLPRLSAVMQTGLFIIVLGSLVALNLYLWDQKNVVMPLAGAVILALAIFIIDTVLGFMHESRNKAKLGKRFGQYVPPELVEEMSLNPDRYSLDAERRDMTVLFTDVRGFTTISEALDPKELADFMNEFLTAMTTMVHRHRGTIDKYMGDAMMAFWGAPQHDPDHAEHAVAAGLDMIVAVDELNQAFKAKGWPRVNIGVGLNSGDMSVGNMGSEFRMAYTVMGDAVNLGSRLEGLTKQYGVLILVGETTARAAPQYLYREIDRVRVKGKNEPVTILQPVTLKETATSEQQHAVSELQRAMECYRNRDWDEAEDTLERLARKADDKIYQIYIERIRFFRAQPPPLDWDSVFTHTEK